jgi:hypothetical protein
LSAKPRPQKAEKTRNAEIRREDGQARKSGMAPKFKKCANQMASFQVVSFQMASFLVRPPITVFF